MAPSTISSTNLAALAAQVERFHNRLIQHLSTLRGGGRIEASAEVLDSLSRVLRGYASDLATESYRLGRSIGHAEGRLEQAQRDSADDK